MILNKNSITAKLYRWFYGASNMPNNLCPYFWKVCFMWIVLLPYSIIAIPAIIFRKQIGKDKGVFDKAFLSGILYLVLYFIFATIYFGFIFLSGKLSTNPPITEMMGAAIWCIGIMIGIGYLVAFIITWIKSKMARATTSTPQSSLIKEMIKAKYNKYCPQIDWKQQKGHLKNCIKY